MSEHTPGPWHLHDDDGEFSVWDDDARTIATVRYSADARLFVAAPGLYDALVAIKERVPLKNDAGMGHDCGECRMCREIAEQALSKAEREP